MGSAGGWVRVAGDGGLGGLEGAGGLMWDVGVHIAIGGGVPDAWTTPP